MIRFRTSVRYAALVSIAVYTLAAAEHRGQVKFGGLPVPGATITATQGDKKVTATTGTDGAYAYPDLADGAWKIAVEMPGFVPIERNIDVGPAASASEWELKMLPLEAMNTQVQSPSPRLAVSAPAPQKSRGTPPPRVTTTQTPFQRAGLNASNTAPPPDAPAQVSGQFDANATELIRRAADGFLVNGTANNGASTPFAQSPAIGNNRPRGRRLYTANLGLILDNSKLDAHPYSLTGQNTARPDYTRVRGVASFGGPLSIPKLLPYGPNVTVNYQWTRNRNVTTQSTLMPSAEERSGDFSQSAKLVNDPTTGLPFPGNTIPVDRLSPQATALLAYYPLPNFSSSRYNYQVPIVNNTHQDNLSTTANYTWRRNQFAGSMSLFSTRTDNPNVFGFLDTGRSSGVNAGLNWRRNFRRTFITAGFQFSRQVMRTTPFFANRLNVAGAAGVTGNNQEPINWGPPALSFSSGIATLNDAQYSLTRNQNSSISFQVGQIPGKHNFTYGGDFRRQQFNTLSQQDPRGTFTFTGATTGSDFAGFLLGIPDTSSIAFGNADKYFRANSWDAFFNDDWRVRAGLTLNVGLRWEYSSPISEIYGRLVNLNVAPGFAAVTPVIGNRPVQPDRNNFAPRIGLAWRPFFASSLVVRGGYGVSFDTSVYQSIASQMAQQSPLSYSLRVQNTPATPLTLAHGFIPSPAITSNTFAVDPRFRVGYAQNWQVSMQKDLPLSMTVIATYDGIKGTRAQQQILPNTFPSGGVSPCATCPSGFAYLTSNGNSIRHAGTIELRRRLRSGLTSTFQYTYAKSIDNAALGGTGSLIAQNWLDLRAERARSNFDQRHVISFETQYTTGMGIGGGTLIDGWKGALFKQWTFSSQINFGTGRPLTPVFIAPVKGTGVTGSIRPDYTGASIYDAPAGFFLNAAAYAPPAPGQWGNAGRNTITGPSQFTMNASIARSFQVMDRMTLDLRIDASNALNHPVFPSWNAVIGSPQFGLRNPANAMRTVETNLRLRF